jgi:hypothetical protein
VAASYDRSNLANRPTFYVNGAKMTTTTLASPSSTPPALSGTGYIGNSSANSRAWNGLIDDLRIYDRVLSDTEIQVLATPPPANIAPLVNAGTNQTVLWPASVNLAGGVSDDGKPNPPGAVSLNWIQLSGPGIVTFGNSNVLSTTANFSVPGTYVLRLTANDGQAQTVSNVTITAVVRPIISISTQLGILQLSWPTNGGNWLLQSQTNPPSIGLGTNWTILPGPVTNPFWIPFSPAAGAVFYRLILTN